MNSRETPDNVLPFTGKQVPIVVKSEAEQRIADIDAAIDALGPKVAMEVAYVRERLHFLMQKHQQAGILALMRVNFEIAHMNGQ